jgi:hypothetical protein
VLRRDANAQELDVSHDPNGCAGKMWKFKFEIVTGPAQVVEREKLRLHLDHLSTALETDTLTKASSANDSNQPRYFEPFVIPS